MLSDKQTNKQKQKQKTLGDRLPDILCLLFIYLFCDVCENALQTDLEDCITSLTYFMSLVSFYTPWKLRKAEIILFLLKFEVKFLMRTDEILNVAYNKDICICKYSKQL